MERPENSQIQNNKLKADLKKKEKQVRLYESPDLFGTRNEIMIRHKGDIYRIRITRNDKLIMNK